MSTRNVACPVVEGNPLLGSSLSALDALPGQLRELEDATHELLELGCSSALKAILTELGRIVISGQKAGAVDTGALGGVLDSVRREVER